MRKFHIWKKAAITGFSLALAIAPVVGCNKEAKAEMAIMAVQDSKVLPMLYISNGTAQCGVTVKGENGVTKIEGSMTLQKVEGNSTISVKSWDFSSASRVYNISKTASVKKGQYRLVVCVKTYKGKSGETIMKTISASY